MARTLFDKLNFREEKNILLQGLPLNIERQFAKINHTKNITPLLRRNKINFALLFSVDRAQLARVAPEALHCLAERGKLWVMYPKKGSKIFSDLNNENAWTFLWEKGFHSVRHINIDHVYDAALYLRNQVALVDMLQFIEDLDLETPEIPPDLMHLFEEFTEAAYYFETLSKPYQYFLLRRLAEAEDIDTRREYLRQTIEILIKGDYTR